MTTNESSFISALERAYNDMPPFFRSTAFTRKCREFGLPETARTGIFSEFLHEKAAIQVRGKGTKTWRKSMTLNFPDEKPKPEKPTSRSRLFKFVEICQKHGAPATDAFYAELEDFFVCF